MSFMYLKDRSCDIEETGVSFDTFAKDSISERTFSTKVVKSRSFSVTKRLRYFGQCKKGQ